MHVHADLMLSMAHDRHNDLIAEAEVARLRSVARRFFRHVTPKGDTSHADGSVRGRHHHRV